MAPATQQQHSDMATINTKLNVNQNAWFMHDNKAKSSTVRTITIKIYPDREQVDYLFNNEGVSNLYLPECECFATKEELLQSL